MAQNLQVCQLNENYTAKMAKLHEDPRLMFVPSVYCVGLSHYHQQVYLLLVAWFPEINFSVLHTSSISN